jgi:hypothetical protein
MSEGVEREHEEVPSRHPLAALSFGAILTFVGGRLRRGPRAVGQSATPLAEQAAAVADRRGIYALLAAETVGQVGNMMVFVAGPGSGPRPRVDAAIWPSSARGCGSSGPTRSCWP